MGNINALDIIRAIKELFSPKLALIVFISCTLLYKLAGHFKELEKVKENKFILIILLVVTGIYLFIELLIRIWWSVKNRYVSSQIDVENRCILFERMKTILDNENLFPYERLTLLILAKNNLQEFTNDSLERLVMKEFKYNNYISPMGIDKGIQELLDKNILEYASYGFCSHQYRIVDIIWEELRKIQITTGR